jgi:chromosome segregation ATPase
VKGELGLERSRTSDLSSSVTSLTGSKRTLEAQNESLVAQLADARSQLEAAHQQIAQLTSKHDRLQDNQAALYNTIRELQAEKEEVDNACVNT